MQFNFQKEKTLEERKKEHEKVMKEYPNKVAIICEKAKNSRMMKLDKTKYLVDKNITLPQFTATIRKKLNLDEREGIFLLANGKHTLSNNENISEIYDKFQDKDGFLYIAYAAEEFWG